MPLGATLNSLRLLIKNLNTDKPTELVVKKDGPDKPIVFPNAAKINFLKREKPNKHGINDKFIESFFNEITSDLSLRPNRILVIKDNAVIGEHYEHPYVKTSWDCIFSATKTIVALALGLMYDEGKVDLDAPVCSILKNEKQISVSRNKKITLRHLLTMSSGNSFNEMETASSKKWVKDYFNSSSKFTPGEKFEYNSLNTYIIGVIIEKLAKEKLTTLIRKRIFDPLGISETYAEISPEGYMKGGWGLYILPEDMAKLGILMRDYGVYEGKRILSEEWIKMMSSPQFRSTKFDQKLDYGFQMWVDEKNNYCAFNGLYDQNILIYRNSGVIVVTCCADSEIFHNSNLFKIAMKYFASSKQIAFDLCNNHGNRNIKNLDKLLYYYDDISNKEFKPTSTISNTCGILPLILQNEMGTYVKGIKSLLFLKENNKYQFVINEGGVIHKLDFDFDKGVRQTINLYGNLYDIVVDARFILSGKGDPFLIIRVYFLEFSFSRYFSIKFGKNSNSISVELSENPGLDFVISLAGIQDEATKSFLRGWMKALSPSLIAGKVKNIFTPIFIAVHGKHVHFLDPKK